MEPEQARDELRGTVLRYDDPTEPVGVDDWEVLRATGLSDGQSLSHPARREGDVSRSSDNDPN